METFTYHLSRALAHQGHEVDLVASVNSTYVDAPRVRLLPLPEFRFSLQDSYLPMAAGLLLGGWTAERRATQALTRGTYDIVNFQIPAAMARVLRIARRQGVPSVMTAHNPVPWRLHREGGLDEKLRSLTYRAVDARMAHRADGVITVGPDLRAALVDGLGLDPARTFYAPVGVETATAQVSDSFVEETRHRLRLPERYVLFVGRFVAQKGLPALLESLAGTRVPLVLVGEGPLRPAIERRAAELGLAQQVQFLGRLLPEPLRAVFRGATAFVLSSVAEGMPVVVLEAAAARLPVVATRVEGVAEMIQDGVTGRIVPIGDRAALRAAIVSIFEDPPAAARMGLAGYRRVVERFSWDVVARETVAAYTEIIERTGHR
ncbi:glycosyltransferase [mine drainage metagenome]|uniref:Glycosyltransferase n=1 Tax=mine drainage metagenome TaxID=410659 RepID=T0YR36_9ZZZZ